MSNKRFQSISQMVESVVKEDSLSKDLNERIASRKVVKALQAMRIAKNIPQSRIAEELGCTQSRVSKIESGGDNDLTLGEFEAYARALNCDVNIAFTNRDETAADRVKRNALLIKQELDKLAECAQSDELIASGVASFFGEAFFNIVRIMEHSSQKLPLRPNGEPYVQMTSTLDCGIAADELYPAVDTASTARKRS